MTVTVIEGDLPASLREALARSTMVAVDTETSGLDWRKDSLHLCQLFTPEVGTVLLRSVDSVPTRLASLLADPAVLKVIHFAPFDLRFLEAHWGVRVASVACTKAASRLLEPTLASHSLKPLLERHLGVVIEKGAVRTSDWSAERLSEEQVAYASGDVSHLLELYGCLIKELDNTGMRQTFNRICEYMPLDAHLDVAGYPNPLTY